eukprot:g281.t1
MKRARQVEGFKTFQAQYLVVYLTIMLADWLQGTNMYTLYEDTYGVDTGTLFLTGFLSSAILGTYLGLYVDLYGRKQACVFFCVIEVVINLIEHVNNFPLLIFGRILSGISSSLLFSAFESWMVSEHRRRNYPEKLLSSTFAVASAGNGVVAILGGLMAQVAADARGDLGPFQLAIALTVLVLALIMAFWADDRVGGLPAPAEEGSALLEEKLEQAVAEAELSVPVPSSAVVADEHGVEEESQTRVGEPVADPPSGEVEMTAAGSHRPPTSTKATLNIHRGKKGEKPDGEDTDERSTTDTSDDEEVTNILAVTSSARRAAGARQGGGGLSTSSSKTSSRGGGSARESSRVEIVSDPDADDNNSQMSYTTGAHDGTTTNRRGYGPGRGASSGGLHQAAGGTAARDTAGAAARNMGARSPAHTTAGSGVVVNRNSGTGQQNHGGAPRGERFLGGAIAASTSSAVAAGGTSPTGAGGTNRTTSDYYSGPSSRGNRNGSSAAPESQMTDYPDDERANERQSAAGSHLLGRPLLETMQLIYRTPSILLLGLSQAFYEGGVFTFVFMWVPNMQLVLGSGKIPTGLIFSCFMLAMTLGGLLYGEFSGGGQQRLDVGGGQRMRGVQPDVGRRRRCTAELLNGVTVVVRDSPRRCDAGYPLISPDVALQFEKQKSYAEVLFF